MAVVKGVKEKVHSPLYDSIIVKSKEQLGKTQSSNVLRFFQDVAGKTKLQTNMQASSLLPHWNTFEARAMRVVISDLPAQYPDTLIGSIECEATIEGMPREAAVNLNNVKLGQFIDFKRRAETPGGEAKFQNNDEIKKMGLTLTELNDEAATLADGEVIILDRTVLAKAENKFSQQILPPVEQIFPNNGYGNLIGKIIYNTVTTFFVGEKTMIQMPTWFFPAGAGPSSENGRGITHGEPSPEATFRFAEPIYIDTQQNFRVEIEIPESEVMRELQKLYGPFFIWVVLDGYMTRDVQ